jgi:hypothetical protein
MGKNMNLYNQAKFAAESLMRHYRKGAYRVIKDPEGVISLWAIEGNPNDPFSISFLIRSNSPPGSTFCHSRGSNRESSLLNPQNLDPR